MAKKYPTEYGVGNTGGGSKGGIFSESALGRLFSGKLGSSANAGESSKSKMVAKDRFAGTTDKDTPKQKAPEKSAMGDTGYKPKKPSNLMANSKPSRPARKPTSYSSGSIDSRKPSKASSDLGAFYLNATSGMDIQSRPRRKK